MAKNAAEKALEKLESQDEKPPLNPEVIKTDGEQSMIVSEFGTAEVALGHFVNKTGLTLPDDLSLKDWVEVASGINTFGDAAMWIVGDWINYGEDHFSQEFSQFVDKLEYPQNSQQEALRISRRYPKESRHPRLSWGHHQAVAALAASEREALLSEAEINHWTRDQLREEMRAREHKEKSAPRERKSKPKKVTKKGVTVVQVMAFIEQEFEPELKQSMKAATAFFKAVDAIKDHIQEGDKGITQKQAAAFADICQATGTEIGKVEQMARRIAAFEIREVEVVEKPKKKAAKAPKAEKAAEPAAAAEKTAASAPAPAEAKPEPKKAKRKGAAPVAAEAPANGAQPTA